MQERFAGSEHEELCPHGRLPGICKECLETEEGKVKSEEITHEAEAIGSVRAKELWQTLESEGKDPKEFIYDVVMVLGAGFRGSEVKDGIDLKERDGLNMEFRMRLNAAAQLYSEGRTRILCLTGGSAISEEWKDFGPLSELAKKYLIKKFAIPECDIIIEDQSDATHGNLAHGMRVMYKDNIPVGKFAILSTNYHLNRAREMAKRSGIQSDFLPAESLLLERSKHYRKFVANWLIKAQNSGMEANEIAKLTDEDYWRRRAALFEAPLDQEVPEVDISADVAATAKRLSEAGDNEGVQTTAF